jgi:hypothetical protein
VVHGTGNGLGQLVPSQPIPVLRGLAPVLPAWLKQIGRSKERVVSEHCSNCVKVWGAISSNKLVDLVSQVRKLGLDNRAQFILGQQTGSTILPNDRHTVQQGRQGLKGIGQCGRSGAVG